MKNRWFLVILGFGGMLWPATISAAPSVQQAAQASPSAQQGQAVSPLVAAARKAREQRAQQRGKAPKVYTNDDLTAMKADGISVVGAAPQAPEAGEEGKPSAAKTPAAPSEAKDESYWRKRFSDARRTLADDSRELDVLQREFNLKQQQFYSDPNVALREQYDRKDLDNTQAQIDAKKADVAKDQQAISDLEDELRKAGGDPGWATPETPSQPIPPPPPSDGQPAQP